MYTHNTLTEGHTFRGQPLGSSAVLGGGGTILSWDRIGSQRSFEATFEIRGNASGYEGGTWNERENGAYLFQITERRTAHGKTYGAWLGLQFGHGMTKGSNLTLGVWPG